MYLYLIIQYTHLHRELLSRTYSSNIICGQCMRIGAHSVSWLSWVGSNINKFVNGLGIVALTQPHLTG